MKGQRLFEDLVVSRREGGHRSPVGAALSTLVHAAGVGALVLVSVAGTEALPTAPVTAGPVIWSPPPPPIERRVTVIRPPVVRARTSGPTVRADAPEPPAPGRAATPIPTDDGGAITDADPGETCISGCDPYGTPDGTGPGSSATGPVEDDLPIGPVRVGIPQVQAPTRIHYVAPVYPEIARRAHIEGTVALDCVIGEDGRVRDIQVLGGPPIFHAAALNAVQQWVYSPTRLNERPVSVVLTVTVTFKLK